MKSWHRTFGFPGMITNCSNNFGAGLNAEKLMPTIINSLVAGHKIPIYGDGLNIRDWLYVDTHVAYLETIMARGNLGHSYLIGGDKELTNLDLVKHIHSLFNARRPDKAKDFIDVFEFVADRKGHDSRYAIDTSQMKSQFADVEAIPFETALQKTLDFYLVD